MRGVRFGFFLSISISPLLALFVTLIKDKNMINAVQITKHMAQNAKQVAAPALSTVASAAASELIRLKVKVDGHPIEVAPGATMLDAIKKSKSRVPTLCFHPEFDPKAVCE